MTYRALYTYKCPECGEFHESPVKSPDQFLTCPDCMVAFQVTTESGDVVWVLVPKSVFDGADPGRYTGSLYLHYRRPER